MNRRFVVSAAIFGGVSIGAIRVGRRLLASRSAEEVDYTVERVIDGRMEVRRYPELVRVETVGDSNRETFRRLFEYISGENASASSVSMTSPVRTNPESESNSNDEAGENIEMTSPVRTGNGTSRSDEGGEEIEMTSPVRTQRDGMPETDGGESVSMTSPVQTEREDGDVRMGFYLPAKYTPNTAPRPTDSQVHLTVQAPRSLATRRYSWWAFDWRQRRQSKQLLETLSATDLSTVGEPFALGYDAPGTPPFLRTNEVAVEVEW